MADRTAQAPPQPGQIVHPAGIWSLFGTWLCAIAIGVVGHGFSGLFSVLIAFFKGDLAHVGLDILAPLRLIAVTGASLAIMLPVNAIVGRIIQTRLGETEDVLWKLFSGLKEKSYFRFIFLTVLMEEIFARWLLLGVVGHVWRGTVAMYALFLIGNTLWALIHYYNAPAEKRHPLRTIVQFSMGIVLTAIYVRYGFMAVLLVHFAFDALVLSINKRQLWNRISLKVAAFHLALATASLVVMRFITHTDIAAAATWVSDHPVFIVAGWHLYDYLLVATLISSVVAGVLELLAYDHQDLDIISDRDTSNTLVTLLGAVIVVLIAFGAFKLLGLMMGNVPHRIIVIALAFMLISNGISGSAVARTFWQSLPSLYISICCMLALGIWGGMAFLLLRSVLSTPERLILRHLHGQLYIPPAQS